MSDNATATADAGPPPDGQGRFDPSKHLARFSDLWRRPLPVILQTETAECGLACLAMVLGWHGVQTDLRTLRQRHVLSVNGTTLSALARMAAGESLNSRAVRLELHELDQLRLPAILHWDMSHFVVLSKVDSKGIHILDPGQGERFVPMHEVSERFSGVAMELWPAPDIKPRDEREKVGLTRLLGRVNGAGGIMARIIGLSLALEVFALTSPLLMQWVTDQVLVARDTNLLTILAIGFLLLGFIQTAISLVRSWVLATAASSLKLQWHSNVMNHLLALPTAWFQKRQLGDVVSRMGSVDSIQGTITSTFLEAALDGLMSILAFTMMMIYSPKLTMLAVLGVLVYIGVRLAWFRPLRQAREDQIVRGAKQTSHLIESIRGVRTLKMFGRQRERLAAWQALSSAELRSGLKVEALGISARGTRDLLSSLIMVAIVWLGAHEVIDGKLSLGMLLAFMSYRGQFTQRLTDLVGRFIDMRMMRLDMDRLSDIVLTEAEPTSSGSRRFGRNADLTLKLENVSFKYAEHEPIVLNDVSLAFKPGEMVAITGPSGGGKSTLLSLILGDLTPVSGQVVVGSQTMDMKWLPAWRHVVGTVLQDDHLFAGTIAENVSCFEPEPDVNRIMQCIQAAAFMEDLKRLPMGLQSLVGDMGTSLSGGQKQRVLLARALYKRPRVLILDEATSHLDVTREAHVMQALAQLRVTRIVVAHRPETVASADRVVELRGGRIVYDGEPGAWLARLRQDASAQMKALGNLQPGGPAGRPAGVPTPAAPGGSTANAAAPAAQPAATQATSAEPANRTGSAAVSMPSFKMSFGSRTAGAPPNPPATPGSPTAASPAPTASAPPATTDSPAPLPLAARPGATPPAAPQAPAAPAPAVSFAPRGTIFRPGGTL